METYSIDAQTRTITGKKVSQLRLSGLVPAVVYGARVQPMHLQIPYRALELALIKAGGTHIITMNIDGKAQSVIARDVQRDVIRGTILHVDFLAVDASTRLTADIPVQFLGESPAVETRIGMLLSITNTLTIEALSSDLISAIEVDISKLENVGDSIHVRDLNLGDKVNVLNDPDVMIVQIAALRVAETTEEEETDEPTSSEPELVDRRRGEDEDED